MFTIKKRTHTHTQKVNGMSNEMRLQFARLTRKSFTTGQSTRKHQVAFEAMLWSNFNSLGWYSIVERPSKHRPNSGSFDVIKYWKINSLMFDVWCLMLDAWCLMRDAWCVMREARGVMIDAWYLILDTWYLILVLDTWYLILDTWYLILDAWAVAIPIRIGRWPMTASTKGDGAGNRSLDAREPIPQPRPYDLCSYQNAPQGKPGGEHNFRRKTLKIQRRFHLLFVDWTRVCGAPTPCESCSWAINKPPDRSAFVTKTRSCWFPEGIHWFPLKAIY